MRDRDLLVLEVGRNVLGRCVSLVVVVSTGAEYVPQAARGDRRVCSRRRDHKNTVLSIDIGRRDGHPRIEVADHELDAVADKLVGDGHALLGIGDVIAEYKLDLLPVDAALGIEVGGSLFGPVLQLRPKGCVRTGQGTGDTDLELSRRAAGAHERCSGNGQGWPKHLFHKSLRLMTLTGSGGASPPRRA